MVDNLMIPYSVVIAARNEAETIGQVLADVQGMTDDLIVVDGNSSDRTVDIARAYGARVVQDHGRGKGEALRVGLAQARRSVVVFMDADGSHDPQDIPKLVGPIAAREADLVIGSRMLGGSDELYGSLAEAIRMLGGLTITLLINFRFGAKITDYQNGFRAIRTDVARAIGLTSDLSTIEQEMGIKCLRYGYRIVERPAHEYRRKGGESKINVMQLAPRYLWHLICELASGKVDRAIPESLPLSQEAAAVSRTVPDRQATAVAQQTAAGRPPS